MAVTKPYTINTTAIAPAYRTRHGHPDVPYAVSPCPPIPILAAKSWYAC